MAAEERDPHRDPLSDESGAHPVSTGVGAAGGAVAGAAAGMLGGPLGMAAGGVVGAVVGSLAGRAAAEAIHPTDEASHGRESIPPQALDTPTPPAGHTAWEDEPFLRADTYPDSGQAMAPRPATASRDLAPSVTSAERSENRRDVIDVLQDLLACCTDSVSSYRSCAQHTRREDLKATFTQRMHDCQRGAQDLQDQIRSLGGEPKDSGGARSALHRGWATVKSTLSADDDTTRLEDAERSEHHALARYREALRQPLPDAVRHLVERQLQAVQRAHDEMQLLRDRLRAAS